MDLLPTKINTLLEASSNPVCSSVSETADVAIVLASGTGTHQPESNSASVALQQHDVEFVPYVDNMLWEGLFPELGDINAGQHIDMKKSFNVAKQDESEVSINMEAGCADSEISGNNVLSCEAGTSKCFDSVNKNDKNICYKCVACDATFVDRKYLREHCQIYHPQFTKHQCLECGRRYTNQPNLEVHIDKMHVSNGEYQCSECSASFRFFSNLKKHEKCHNEAYHWKCPECGEHFSQDRHLRYHMEAMHGIGEVREGGGLSCSQCKKKFMRQYGLNRHCREEHDNVCKFRCHECPEVFKRDVGLRRHQLVDHGIHVKCGCMVCGIVFSSNVAHALHDQTKKHASKVRRAGAAARNSVQLPPSG